jgi:tRNA uridine 5-carboxymethylaminomethyl modification enzyme
MQDTLVEAPKMFRRISDVKLENVKLPKEFDFHNIQSLSYESREKLNRYQPETLGQASRISGISPADINVLAIFLGR